MNTPPDVDLLADLYDKALLHIMDKYAPVQTRTARPRCGTGEPLSNLARNAKRKCRRLERVFMKSRLLIDKNNLEAKKLAREAILSSRSDHIKEQIHGATSSAKQLWNVANKILHRNIAPPTPDDDCQKLATSFCSYFTEKIKTIHNSISASLSIMPPSAILQQ